MVALVFTVNILVSINCLSCDLQMFQLLSTFQTPKTEILDTSHGLQMAKSRGQ